jgi:hypothetical protein
VYNLYEMNYGYILQYVTNICLHLVVFLLKRLHTSAVPARLKLKPIRALDLLGLGKVYKTLE